MDISTKAVKESTVIHLDGPDGEPLLNEHGEHCSITVYGAGSKQYKRAQAERNQGIMELMGRKKGGKALDTSRLDAELLASCTIAFNGFQYKDLVGREMFLAAYLDPGIGWMGEQVNKEIAAWENFI